MLSGWHPDLHGFLCDAAPVLKMPPWQYRYSSREQRSVQNAWMNRRHVPYELMLWHKINTVNILLIITAFDKQSIQGINKCISRISWKYCFSNPTEPVNGYN